MTTTNTQITKADGWVEVSGNLLSNGSNEICQFAIAQSIPAIALSGHPLLPTEGFSRADLELAVDDKMYFKTQNQVVIISSE